MDAAPPRPLSALSHLPAAERHQVVAEWSLPGAGAALESRTPAPRLHELVHASAARAPDAVALDGIGRAR